MSFHYALHSRPISCSFVLWPATFLQPDRLKHRLELAHRQFTKQRKKYKFFIIGIKEKPFKAVGDCRCFSLHSGSTRLLEYMNHICRFEKGPARVCRHMKWLWDVAIDGDAFARIELRRADQNRDVKRSLNQRRDRFWRNRFDNETLRPHRRFHSPCHWLFFSFPVAVAGDGRLRSQEGDPNAHVQIAWGALEGFLC